ncbi:hypothetical protein A33M_4101 [Rhodovulum sp. PH10]|uniref:lysylphosphatidylglycerol synthase transmembrane domain-containing protein n=1 Tax=Rhodovulum sp. PH10 TaxID=1187851 RepID=UPI00027C2805|nr:YbhN family protein [Rhodovulum sp. PH10]EJW10700.1 hypothetical protein A33M_4101 [Rhodovulum sp. PH10]
MSKRLAEPVRACSPPEDADAPAVRPERPPASESLAGPRSWSSLRSVLARFNWNWIGAALALTIIGISIAVLVKVLQGIEIAQIETGLKSIPPERLVLAGLCVLCAYGTLTFYDWFALRTIGKTHVPYRTAVLASFSSYAIGHNVGATAFSAGAIRYRIYSYWGMTAIDVAKLCFVTGLTFWLGNLTVLGFALTLDPRAVTSVDQLPASANFAIGVALLCVLVGYVAWVGHRPRKIGWKSFLLTLPNGRSTLLQILIGIADLTFCATAMFMLVPADPPVHFVTVAAVFISATLLGFASHAPGSLGVFDAAMLIGLPFFEKEALIAGLLIFRLMYFITPFAIALTVMGTREVWVGLHRRRNGARAAPKVSP